MTADRRLAAIPLIGLAALFFSLQGATSLPPTSPARAVGSLDGTPVAVIDADTLERLTRPFPPISALTMHEFTMTDVPADELIAGETTARAALSENLARALSRFEQNGCRLVVGQIFGHYPFVDSETTIARGNALADAVSTILQDDFGPGFAQSNSLQTYGYVDGLPPEEPFLVDVDFKLYFTFPCESPRGSATPDP